MAQYLCKECGAQAEKPACKKGGSGSLGTWGCPRCGNGVKVTRKGTGDTTK